MPTVYDGVIARDGGGGLFDGQKFWIAAIVPQRQRWIDAVNSNGGTIVRKEAEADHLISDHAKLKHAPAGSLTWKFIQDSLQNGEIADPEDYRIGRNPDVPRPPGGVEVPKGTRTRFTSQDDEIIKEWVQNHGGLYSPNLGGNVIWQELGLLHHHHTWQSWRDRWRKKVIFTVNAEPSVPVSRSRPPPISSNETSRTNATIQAFDHQTDAARETSTPSLPQSTPAVVQVNRVKPQSVERVSTKNHLAANDSRATTRSPSPIMDEITLSIDEMNREEFYSHFREYMDVTGLFVEEDPEVEGRIVDLHDLTKAVRDQHVLIDQVDWNMVAEMLSYNWLALPSVPGELKACYDKYMAAFVAELDAIQVEEPGQESSTETEDGLSDVERNAEHQPATPPLQRSKPSSTSSHQNGPSPSLSTSPKRKLEPDYGAPHGFDFDARMKRRRRDRDDEIPSTPDETDTLPVASSSKSKAFTVSTKPLPSPSNGRKSTVPEPETQDMAFEETQRPRLLAKESSLYDISPSQQLHIEADDVRPVPFSVKRTDRRGGSPGTLVASPPRRGPSRIDEGQPSPSPKKLGPVLDARTKDANDMEERTPVAPKRRLPSTFSGKPTTTPRLRKSSSPKAQAVETIAGSRNTGGRAQASRDTETEEMVRKNMNAVDECIKNFEVHYPPNIVRAGLACTTLKPGLAGLAMQSLWDGKGVPKNYQGIWTKEDDDNLRFADSIDMTKRPKTLVDEHLRKAAEGDFEALVRKHGLELIDERRKFLAIVSQLDL